MTIDRHPDPLKKLVQVGLESMGWQIYKVSFDSLNELDLVPLEEVDAVLLAPARRIPPRHMDRLSHCKIMQIWSSGYDKFNIEDAHLRKIPVANNHGSNAVSVAEHTILMMLGVSRRAPEMHNRVIHGNWAGNDHGMSSYSLAGKTLGIVGMGNIGTKVAQRADALGMRIVFADPAVTSKSISRWERISFRQLLFESDYISFHVHLTENTKSMINSKNLSLLKRRPFLINVSRAELIEEGALLDGLASGQIRGAAMDAHYVEPNDSHNPFFKLPNVFVSPHVAGSTVDSYTDTIQFCIRNISSAIKGQGFLGSITPAN